MKLQDIKKEIGPRLKTKQVEKGYLTKYMKTVSGANYGAVTE